MLIERQFSIAFAGISAALVVPAYTHILNGNPAAATSSPAALLIGTVLGALAVLMGLLLSVGDQEGTTGGYRLWLLLKTSLWSASALCLSAGTGMAAMLMPGPGWRIALGITALSPLVGPAPRKGRTPSNKAAMARKRIPGF